MLFTKKPNNIKIDDFTVISVDKILPRLSEFKFLRVTFDAQLTFKAHINNITKNSKSTLNLLRAISGTSWGAQTKAMHIYTPELTMEPKPTIVPHPIYYIN